MTPFKQMNGNFYRAYSFVTFKVISALILPFPRPLRQYKKPPCADIAPAYNGDALLSHSDRNICKKRISFIKNQKGHGSFSEPCLFILLFLIG